MQGVSRDYDWEEMLGGNGSKDEPGKISMRNAWGNGHEGVQCTKCILGNTAVTAILSRSQGQWSSEKAPGRSHNKLPGAIVSKICQGQWSQRTIRGGSCMK